MNKQGLYELAYNLINHKKLRQFGTAGHVSCALKTVKGNIFTGYALIYLALSVYALNSQPLLRWLKIMRLQLKK